MKSRILIVMLALAGLGSESGVVSAAAPTLPDKVQTGQPASWPAPTGPAAVTGLGSARFGTALADLPNIVAADFGAAAGAALHRDDSMDLLHRQTMVTSLRWMNDAVPARIGYVFFEGKLVQVNVDWAIPEYATADQRGALVATAEKVTANLYASYWTIVSLRKGAMLDPNAVLVFAGEDALGRGVEVTLFGMDLSREGGKAPAPGSGALLRVTYAFDIFARSVIKPGDF